MLASSASAAQRPQVSRVGAPAGMVTRLLPPLLPPSASVIWTELVINGDDGLEATMTANNRLECAPGARLPTECVQVVPGGLPTS